MTVVVGRAWTPQDEAILREMYAKVTPEELGKSLGRSAIAIKSRAKVLRVKRDTRKPWSAEELAIVREQYPHHETSKIAAELGRTVSGIYQHADKIGLKKTAEYLASEAACRLRRGDNVGKAYRYPKGHVPANKGLRRPGWAPGRMAETQFKPGVRQGIAAKNWCPVGTVRPDGDGFLRIKIREWHPGENTGFGNTKIWPLLNRHIWEQHNGPIPAGHIVIFKDGNRANCVIGNLELITLVDNMRRNSLHRYPKDIALAIQAVGALQRQINKRERPDAKEQDARPT
jgi:hypothetical protein